MESFFGQRIKFLKYKKINNFAVKNFPKIYEEALGMIRYSKYIGVVTTKNGVQIVSLPSSENATQQHPYQVYLQVMDWKLLEEAHNDPLEWGWVFCNGSYIQSDLLHQVICSSLYIASANIHQKVLAQQIVLTINVADNICKGNEKRNIFDIFDFLDTSMQFLENRDL